MRELISNLKKKKKAQAGIELSNIFPKIFAREEKACMVTSAHVPALPLATRLGLGARLTSHS